MYYDHFKSIIGTIYVTADNEHLLEISFTGASEVNNNAITDEAIVQLKQYFNGERKSFNLPLKIEGTDYTKEVYRLMCDISYGEVSSYKALAEQSSSKKAFRRVGTICGLNRFMIVVPCHRVVLANGELGNYAHGIEIKEKLLNFETSNNK